MFYKNFRQHDDTLSTQNCNIQNLDEILNSSLRQHTECVEYGAMKKSLLSGQNEKQNGHTVNIVTTKYAQFQK